MKFFVINLLILSSVIYSQNFNTGINENKQELRYKQFPAGEIKLFADSTGRNELKTEKRSSKSPGLAFIYSLLVPGLGHAYAHRFETGKYFLISEAALWISFTAFTIYGNWLLDDAYNFSVSHAGVNLTGKERDAKFFTDIANYNSVYDYNDEQLRFGDYEKLYDPQAGFYFFWDNELNRKKYREDKLAGDRTLNDRLFIIGAVVVNHIVSAISAVFAANSYNKEIKSGGRITFNAGIKKHFNRIDGIAFNVTKWF